MAALQVGIHTNTPNLLLWTFNCVYACTKHDSWYGTGADQLSRLVTCEQAHDHIWPRRVAVCVCEVAQLAVHMLMVALSQPAWVWCHMHVTMHVPCRANDVQVEFTMLDPHVRATLKPDNKVRAWDMHADCNCLCLQHCCHTVG